MAHYRKPFLILISDFQHSQLVLGDCFELITYVSVLQWPNQWIFLLLHCTKIYGWKNWGEKHCLTCIHLLTHISPPDSWILNSWIKGAANWYFVIYHIKIIYNIILSTFLYTHSYSHTYSLLSLHLWNSEFLLILCNVSRD